MKAAIAHLKTRLNSCLFAPFPLKLSLEKAAKIPEKQDLVFDRPVNNELNALIEAKNALEARIEELKLNIIRKKIEKSEYFCFSSDSKPSGLQRRGS